MKLLKIICGIATCCLCTVAHATTTCDLGQYLNDDKCTNCTRGYYCPDENTMIPCPTDTNNWYEIFTAQGHDVISVVDKGLSSWQPITGKGAYSRNQCITQIECVTKTGAFYIQRYFDGTVYYQKSDGNELWFSASTGYYLSPYSFTSSRVWYHDVKPCTNAPDNAHYTGAGTPDAPDGSVTDANDCPWACNDGYGNHGGECVPLCSAGVRYIRADNGLRINLYPIPYSSPRLAVEYNNDVCYGILAPGVSGGTININYNGNLYHTVN